jgi:hypothetical protein
VVLLGDEARAELWSDIAGFSVSPIASSYAVERSGSAPGSVMTSTRGVELAELDELDTQQIAECMRQATAVPEAGRR